MKDLLLFAEQTQVKIFIGPKRDSYYILSAVWMDCITNSVVKTEYRVVKNLATRNQKEIGKYNTYRRAEEAIEVICNS